MTTTQIRLEDVRRALRLGAVFALAGSAIVLTAGLAAGLSVAAAAGLAALALPAGVLSGGFGLAVRALAIPSGPRPPAAPAAPARPLRVVQPR
jgi:hypothetical protein